MALFNLCAGHGAEDSGAVGPNRRLEKDDNLRISLAVGEELIKRGHTVRQLRVDDTINNAWQVCRDWLEKNPADFSVVFHRNAYNGKVGGVEVWSFDSDSFSTEIAKEMSKAIAEAGGFSNRGRKGNGAAWLSPNVRCCQLETGFIDNDSENVKFDMKFVEIVNAICDTLEKFFGKVVKEETTNEQIKILTEKNKELSNKVASLEGKLAAIKNIVEG